MDYFVDLGVDTIRLSPFYSSPRVDSGNDILNHTDIDLIYGDFDDFDELINEAHEKGIINLLKFFFLNVIVIYL